MHQLAVEENWPEVWTAERLRKIQASADRLVETARGVQLDVDIAEWVEKVHSLWPDMARHTIEVLEEKSTNYIFIELECEVLEFEDYSQKLERLIEEARAAHFAGRLRYEE